MKILKWILIVIVVLIVIGSIGLFIFLKNFDINRYKPQIIAQVSKQIDHPVTLDRLELEFSFKKGINVALHDLVILEKEAPADAMPILKIAKTAVGVDVQSYLTRHQVIITGIEVGQLFVHVVQMPDGSLNVQSLTPKTETPAQNTAPENAPAEQASSAKPATAPAFDLSTFHIRLIELTDAQVIFDQMQADGTKKTVTLNDIDGRIDDFGFGDQFPFAVKLSIFSPRQNIELKGKISVKEDFSSVEVLDTSIKSQLDNIDIKALSAFDPSIAQLGFKENLKGDLQVQLQRLLLLNNAVNDFVFDVRLTDGKIALSSLQYPIENIDMHLTGKYPTVSLKEFFMYIGTGKIRAEAQVEDVLKENKFNGQLVIEDVRLEELIAQETPYKLVGKLFGDIYFNGSHTPARPVDQALVTEATFSLKDAAIKNLNVLREVLNKLAFIGLGKGLEERLPPNYQEALKSDDTVFQKCFVHSTVQDAMVNVDKVEVDGDGFNIRAQGTMNLAQQLSLQADFYIPADLARTLLSEDSQFLLDEEERLHIPFKPYRGPLTKLKIFPDVEQIGKDVVKKKGKNELQKAIFKALDIEDPNKEQPTAPPPQPSSQQSPPPQDNNSSSEKILIENVLDKIFK